MLNGDGINEASHVLPFTINYFPLRSRQPSLHVARAYALELQ